MEPHQSKLNSCIRDVWQRKQNLNIVSGSLAFLRWGVSLFLLGMFIDWMTFMPTAGRMIMFLIMLVVAIIMAWRKGWSQLHSFNARDTALQIEETLGDCNSLLVTAVQFGKPDMEHGTSAMMMEHTCKQAEAKVATLVPEKIVSFGGLKKPMSIILGLALILVIFAGISTEFLGAGLSRLFPPWLAVKYPTRTKIELKSQHLVIKEGSEALIQANITGVIPDNAKIAIRTKSGKARVRKVLIADGICEYKIKSAYRGFEYRILAGDDRSDWKSVTVIAAPRIDKAEVTLTYPAYTQRPQETVDALTLSAPEGTKAVWTLTLDQPVRSANVVTSIGKPQELIVSEDGYKVVMEQIADNSRSYKFTWVEKNKGYTFTSPSNYLQVQTDEEPQVEIAKPEKNIFATLGRKVDIAYRARDDHGIGEAFVCYRINKNQEKKIKIELPKHGDKSVTSINWDYTKHLTQLKIGDSVSFLFEMADRYPGKEGPHRVRTQARRLSILSKIDYLKRIKKQKDRMLKQVKNIYREEREVHSLVKDFDALSDTFIQTCQLEIVRQELIKERLLEIKKSMGGLVADLVANNFNEKKYTGEFTFIQSEIQKITTNQISSVSEKLKALSAFNGKENSEGKHIEAIDAANFAARELGVMVLQLGFREATEIMAREIHTISEDQATLRLQSILSGATLNAKHQILSKRQSELSKWLNRIFKELPKDRLSGEEDAIVAFKLSRLIKEVKRGNTEALMLNASKAIANGNSKEAAAIQAEVIKILLAAEFKLRNGLEHEALKTARNVFNNQIQAQKELQEVLATLGEEEFKERKDEVKHVQKELSKRLALILMPAFPAGKFKLLDAVQPAKAPIEKYLANSESILKAIEKAIDDGDKNKTIAELKNGEKAFAQLAHTVTKRLESLSEATTVAAIAAMGRSSISNIGAFQEQLLGILEKTEDAEADETDAKYIAVLQNKLTVGLQKFKSRIIRLNQRLTTPSKSVEPVINYLDIVIQSSKLAETQLKQNKATEAIEHQSKIEETFETTIELITTQNEDMGSFSAALSSAKQASTPIPLMLDIRFEQDDMVKTAEKMKADDLPGLAVAQKNLIHAVNASLTYLDPYAHHIETGSVMLFAKTDMDAAAEGMRLKDKEETIDAGSFVSESIQGVIDQMYRVLPQYSYVSEISEFNHEHLNEVITIMALQKQLAERSNNANDKNSIAAITVEQENLFNRSKLNTESLLRVINKKAFQQSTIYMETALRILKTGDSSAAAEQMNLASEALTKTSQKLLELNTLIGLVLAPPITPIVPPEHSMLVDFTELATHQKIAYRQTHIAKASDTKKLLAKQKELTKKCGLFVKRVESLYKEHLEKQANALKKSYERIRNPKTTYQQALASLQKRLTPFYTSSKLNLKSAFESLQIAEKKLASNSIKEANDAQHKATVKLRSFYIDNILALLTVPGPPPPGDPAPSYEISEEDPMEMGMAGTVSGQKIKGTDTDWNVLGRRDRAALNENFARELPLEYRGLLKNYYERLAQ